MKKLLETYKLILILVTLCVSFTEASFWGLDWVWGKEDNTENETPVVIDGLTLIKVPFEAKTEDDKFLDEAKKYTSLKLSDLDTCQHKVVMKIHTSCSDMTEEQLAKLSVNLLNCQSAVEGRKLFPCTDNMSLRQCTGSMDADTWNTYHLMSNRARAVCYAARHQQFRALSEMTVNKLMNTAHDQIIAMNTLKEGQQKLESLTAGTMNTVATGQESLLQQQERMRVTQQNLKDFVSLNLRQLTKEKALIAAGHQELSKLTEDVKEKLDAANSQLMIQSVETRENHEELLKDLRAIQAQAKVIWNEIEHSTQEILAHHKTAAAKYEDTLLKLATINETVTFLLHVMETTRQELDERLGWLGSVVGAAGIYMFLLHGLYLLVGMIATSFLQAPALTKLCLVLLVPLNLAVIYNQGTQAALDFSSMTMLILTSTAVHWFITSIQAIVARQRQKNRLFHQPHSTKNGFSVHPPSPPAVQLSFQSQVKLWWTHLKETLSAFATWSESWFFNKTSVGMNSPGSPRFSKLPDADDAGDSSGSDSGLMRDYYTERLGSYEDVTRLRETDSPLRQRLSVPRSYLAPPTPSRSSSRSGTPLRTDSSRPSTPRPLCRATCRSGLLCRNSATPGSDVCRIHSLEIPFL